MRGVLPAFAGDRTSARVRGSRRHLLPPGGAALPPPGKPRLGGEGKPAPPEGCGQRRYRVPGTGPPAGSPLRRPPSPRRRLRSRCPPPRNRAGAFGRPCPGRRVPARRSGKRGSGGGRAQLPDIRNLNPCTSKHPNYPPGLQRLPRLLKPTAHPGHAGEQTGFRSQIWGCQAAPAMAAPLRWPRRKAAPEPLHRNGLLTPPRWMRMEGQFGPKHPHQGPDLLVRTYPWHRQGQHAFRPGAEERQHPKYPRLHPRAQKAKTQSVTWLLPSSQR